MTDIRDRLQAIMHLESAAISPLTNNLIETCRAAQEEIDLLRVGVEQKDAEIKQLRERIESLVIRECQQRYKAEASWGKIYDLREAVRSLMADD